MADSGDLIDFNVIESHKENIQALPSGRSAKALAQLYSPSPLGAAPSSSAAEDANSKCRAAFEKELLGVEEADDPLDVYDRYVKWTMDAYPSAQATPQSQLLPLLERATKSLQATSHYKNDPRYLKLWLHYIRLFSDAPREVFVFLARNGIGENLALYYEEYAAWLENAGRWHQAEEVYSMGIERDARPAERLLRKFGEFERRKEALPADADEPSSPALPTVRPALAAKMDPFATASSSTQPQQANSTTTKKPKSSKMQIFSDGEERADVAAEGSSKGWDNIGSLADRKKENSVAAKPMAGERLKVGKTNGSMQKMTVFKDASSKQAPLPRHLSTSTSRSAHAHQCVLNPKNGRLECVFVNLNAVYPKQRDASSEYCFEELRARHRGWLGKRQLNETVSVEESAARGTAVLAESKSEGAMNRGLDVPDHVEGLGSLQAALPKERQRGFKIFEDALGEKEPTEQRNVTETNLAERFSNSLALNDENDENHPPAPQPLDLAKQARREARANRTRKIKVMDVKHVKNVKNETKTIQLNMDSPTRPKPKRKKSTDRAEPTMTINTKEAMDEIYGIFCQPLPSQTESVEAEDDGSDDDCTTGDESTGTGKLSAPASEYGDDTRHELLDAQKAAEAEDDGRANVTGWSDFTTSKHVPQQDSDESSIPESAQSTTWALSQEPAGESCDPSTEPEELITPQEENFRSCSVPLPPENYEPSPAQPRDVAFVPNHRLPFMTPIAEQTESSLGATTSRAHRDYFSARTPSRNANAPPLPSDDDGLLSSPFQEVTTELADVKQKVLQPVRTKSTKGTISLGHGTAKSQIAAKCKPATTPEPPQRGPIIKEQQCNPMDPDLRDTILSEAKPSILSFEGYHDHRDVDSGRTAEIRKWIKVTAKASRSSANLEKTAQALGMPPTLRFDGGETQYTVRRELGSGTFAPVYLVENSAAAAQKDENGSNDDAGVASRYGQLTHRKHLEAIKMEAPPSAWEYYMIRQAHRRLGVSRPAESVVRAHEMHLFRDECFLVEEFRDQGTLLDLVNLCRAEGGVGGGGGSSGAATAAGMDEALAMWATAELLRTVEALHARQLIHGDLKGDNVLVRLDDPSAETDWSPTYFASGAHGWASKGVCLIDFGRGIDMRQFGPGVAFVADWATGDADCAEMREMRPWTYQIDYHGLAGTVHSMLFGKYMETLADRGGGGVLAATKTYRIRESFKRYWQVELWAEVFQLLLNPLAHVAGEEGGRMPVLKGMRACRERMEGWLEENCERGVGLKSTIARMEGLIRERRRRSRVGV